MAENFISHHRPRRKRASAWTGTTRRLIALALTLGALAAIAQVAPYLHPAPLRYPELRPPVTAVAPLLPEPGATIELAGPPTAPPRPRRPGVPLNAAATAPGEDFEVLSAAELADISQARN
jgi:hypothetical protein